MNLNSKKVFVVIPAYKAESTIEHVVRRIPKKTYEMLQQIIIVEDGSYIGESSILHRLKKEFPKIELLFHSQNLGYAAAQKSGLAASLERSADIVAILHADGQYPPEFLDPLLEPLLSDQCDLVLGSRMHSIKGAYIGGMPVYKIVANILLTRIQNFVFSTKLTEFHSGFMLYSARALQLIPFQKLSRTFHFDGEMLIFASLLGLRIKDLPIPTYYGNEKSHLNPIIYGFDVLRLSLKYRLLHFFKQI